jgi:hypothetical protein
MNRIEYLKDNLTSDKEDLLKNFEEQKQEYIKIISEGNYKIFSEMDKYTITRRINETVYQLNEIDAKLRVISYIEKGDQITGGA